MNNVLVRKVGLELEGYVDIYPKRIRKSDIHNINQIVNDSTLNNSDWSYKDEQFYGVEFTTKPLRELESIGWTVRDLEEYGWFVDEEAGLHVHVECKDYDTNDYARLLWFAKQIEPFVYLLVDDSRYNEQYTSFLPDQYRYKITNQVNAEAMSERLNLYNALKECGLANTKNHWLYAFTPYNTIEFRIFHATTSAKEIRAFTTMAHNFVELVKSHTYDDLGAFVDALYSCESAEGASKVLCRLLGVNLPAVGRLAMTNVATILEVRNAA